MKNIVVRIGLRQALILGETRSGNYIMLFKQPGKDGMRTYHRIEPLVFDEIVGYMNPEYAFIKTQPAVYERNGVTYEIRDCYCFIKSRNYDGISATCPQCKMGIKHIHCVPENNEYITQSSEQTKSINKIKSIINSIKKYL